MNNEIIPSKHENISASVYLTLMEETLLYLKSRLPEAYQKPLVGIVCGSGLSNLGNLLIDAISIDYENIPHFPRTTVKGHGSCLLVGLLNGTLVACLLGRFHYYEGHSLHATVFPIRILAALGIKSILLTNAAGGLDPSFQVGDLMVIEDHISFLQLAGLSALRGENIPIGPRFPALTEAYHPDSKRLIEEAAIKANVNGIVKGIYINVGGPCYETPAEIRLFRGIGGGAVGMSTVPEVVAAVHAGVKVVAISLITNIAIGGGMDEQTRGIPMPTHEEVLITAKNRAKDLESLTFHLVPSMVGL